MVKSIKRRYIAFKLTAKSSFSKNEILEALIEALPKTNDQHPLDMEYIRVMEYDKETGLGIIRCHHKSVDILRPSFKKITQISTDSVNAEVLGVSGTIKALRRKFLSLIKE